MPRCKAPEIPRSESYMKYVAATRDDPSSAVSRPRGNSLVEASSLRTANLLNDELLRRMEGNAADGRFSATC